MAEFITPTNCPIFNTSADVERPDDRDGVTIHSPRAGGKYFITGTAVTLAGTWDDTIKIKLARWIYEQNQLEVIPSVNSDTPNDMGKRRNLKTARRADELLKMVISHNSKLGDRFRWVRGASLTAQCPREVVAATESNTFSELSFLFNYLHQDGKLKKNDHLVYEITPHGHNYLEGTSDILSNQAFVAMWFNDAVKEAYEKGIEPAIRDAGFDSMRIDGKETNNKIDDEIIAEIRKSKFVIADFTSGFIKDADVSDEDAIKGAQQNKLLARGGVYYEAGFAQGLGIPVIWTCHADCINHVHFDTRQYNHIVWKTPDELYTKLKHRIEATIA